jgi:hypothetical protein
MKDNKKKEQKMKQYFLESGNSGNDAYLEGTYEECLQDVLNFFEIKTLPENWELIKVDWE